MTRTMLAATLCLTLATGAANAQSEDNTIKQVDFEQASLGPHSDEAVKRLWGDVQWASTHGRASIVPDAEKGKCLRIEYPKGAVGPRQGGTQFVVNLPPADSYWLTYDVQFEEGFDFRLGGKMPGLTSGGGKYTGGHKPDKGQGWSARYMFGKNGGSCVYLYYVDMPGKWGQGLKFPGFSYTPGKWHRLTQHITLNDPDGRNGRIEVWIDGKKVLDRGDLRLRIGNQGRIDSLNFSTFHGGNTPPYGPNNDSYARFDNFTISTTPPEGLVD